MLYFTIEKRLQDGIGKVPEAAGARWRFYRRISSDIVGLSSDIVGLSSDYRRISSNRLSIGGSIQGVSAEILSFKISWQAQYLVRLEGDFTPRIAPRIGNEVSYVTQIIDDIHFAWQAQYLVKLEGDLTGSAHWKWRFICFICDADHWWHWFCVAGAVFGEVGGSFCVAGAVFAEVGVWLFVTGAALRDILGDSRNAKCCILQ